MEYFLPPPYYYSRTNYGGDEEIPIEVKLGPSRLCIFQGIYANIGGNPPYYYETNNKQGVVTCSFVIPYLFGEGHPPDAVTWDELINVLNIYHDDKLLDNHNGKTQVFYPASGIVNTQDGSILTIVGVHPAKITEIVEDGSAGPFESKILEFVINRPVSSGNGVLDASIYCKPSEHNLCLQYKITK